MQAVLSPDLTLGLLDRDTLPCPESDNKQACAWPLPARQAEHAEHLQVLCPCW